MTNALTEELIDKVAVPFICMIGLPGRQLKGIHLVSTWHTYVHTYECIQHIHNCYIHMYDCIQIQICMYTVAVYVFI